MLEYTIPRFYKQLQANLAKEVARDLVRRLNDTLLEQFIRSDREDHDRCLVHLSLNPNVSDLEQTVKFLPHNIVLFPLDAPSSQAGARKPRGFDIRIGSRSKSQAKFQTAARRESSEDSMKRAFLLMVVPALLVALGFAQTPAASVNTDQTKIKGCLGGSDANYTIVADNTGHIFKITTTSVDLKPHVGHDVTLIGHKASGTSSDAADNSVAVTELNMISEHCPAAATAPVGSISTPAETTVTPAVADAVPATTISTPADAITPAVPAAAPGATVSTTPQTAVTPAAAPAAPPATTSTPAETAVTPAVAAAAPVATISTPTETTVTPDAAAVHPARLPARSRRPSATPAVAPTTPVTAGTSSETVSAPDAAATSPAATASTSSETDSTPAAVPTTPTAPARRGSLWLLIAFAVLVIVLGILAPSLSRWRKRKSLERTGTPNLSFTRDASSDKAKSDEAESRKVA